MPQTLVLASNNRGKLAELLPLFAPLGLSLITQGSLNGGAGIGEAEEPFVTFVENALAKARHAAQHSGLPALADDAGLCVEAFGGQPGVQTAHFCAQYGLPKSDDNNRSALLQAMQHLTEPQERRASMVSTLVAVRSPEDPQPLIAVGRVQGVITPALQGSLGFGFDPVFLIPSLGLTFAQMPPEQKSALSHRGQAAQLMVKLMREAWLG